MSDPLTTRHGTAATSAGTVFATLGPDARAYECYAQADLAGGRVLLYDREEETAWLTADVTVPLTEIA